MIVVVELALPLVQGAVARMRDLPAIQSPSVPAPYHGLSLGSKRIEVNNREITYR